MRDSLDDGWMMHGSKDDELQHRIFTGRSVALFCAAKEQTVQIIIVPKLYLTVNYWSISSSKIQSSLLTGLINN